MSRWFRMYDELLDDPKVQRLSGEDFKASLLAAVRGDESVISPYLVGPYDRLLSHEWALLRSEVFERDDYTCTYCGKHGVALECDHVVPVSQGGSNEISNLTTACKPCNRSKAGKSLKDWKA